MKPIEEFTTHTVLVSGPAFYRQNIHILWLWICDTLNLTS